MIAAHHIDGDREHGRRARRLVSASELFLLVRLGGLLDDAAAPIEAVRRDAMAQMRLPRLRVGRQRRRRESIVRAMHTAPRGRLATFLNWHKFLYYLCLNRSPSPSKGRWVT